MQINIYNQLGRLVRTLVDEQKLSGEYSSLWNGRDEQANKLACGIYLYRLNTGVQQSVKKMILLQ